MKTLQTFKKLFEKAVEENFAVFVKNNPEKYKNYSLDLKDDAKIFTKKYFHLLPETLEHLVKQNLGIKTREALEEIVEIISDYEENFHRFETKEGKRQKYEEVLKNLKLLGINL